MTFRFRPLTPSEEAMFRKWARDNYEALTPITGVWHPVVQDECAKINAERGLSVPHTIANENITLDDFGGGYIADASSLGFAGSWPAAVMFRDEPLTLAHREVVGGELLFCIYTGGSHRLTIFND